MSYLYLERSILTVVAGVSEASGDTDAVDDEEDLYILGSWIDSSERAKVNTKIINHKIFVVDIADIWKKQL